MTGRVFITGATGLLGQFVLRNLLARHVPVVALTRPEGPRSGRDRVEQCLARHEELLSRALPRPVVIEGELHEPRLGLSTQDVQYLGQNCDSVIHAAASICFHASADGEPYRTNVAGTRNLLDVCDAAGIADLHSVSTAYVCGQRHGRILEADQGCEVDATNDYERSKQEAESLVRASPTSRRSAIYRPSIIVGDLRSGYTSTYHGFYTPLQLSVELTRQFGYLAGAADSLFQALGLIGREGKNLVPLDWVAESIVRLWLDPRSRGRTFHLTNPRPVSTETLKRVIADTTWFVAEKLPASRNQPRVNLESLAGFQKAMDVYRTYLRDDPEFDCRETVALLPDYRCPELDYATLMRLARYAIDAGFGWPRPKYSPTDLDVGELLEEAAGRTLGAAGSVAEHPRLLLQVSGCGGGAWQIATDSRRRLLISPVLVADETLDPLVYTQATAFRSLVQGQLTLDELVRAGQVVIFGSSAVVGSARRFCEDLIAILRELHSLAAAGGVRQLTMPPVRAEFKS